MPEYDSEHIPRSAMAIFAHPDDAEFTVSGTIARWTRAGSEVTLVLITSGNAGTHDPAHTRTSIARTREREQRAAARVLGVKRLVFLRRDDCTLQPSIELRKELVREIRRHRPEVVLCGDPEAWFHGDRYINHPDHRAAAAAALDAVAPCAEMELLWPEAGTPHKVRAVYVASARSPNTWIDITGTIDTKIASLKAHASQMGGWDPSAMIREWARAEARKARDPVTRGGRSARKLPGRSRYAESFRVIKLRTAEERPESQEAQIHSSKESGRRHGDA